MNRVILSGRLVNDPKITGKVASFTLAVQKKFVQEGQQSADFINCKMLGEKLAGRAEKFLRKGMLIAFEGAWTTGNYINKDGQRVYTNECIGDFEFLEKKKDSAEQTEGRNSNDFMSVGGDIDEGLPFA